MQDIKYLEKVFKVLANRRRLAIINCLRKNKEIKVGDIANEIRLSLKSTSKHLIQLFNAGIVEREQRGLLMYYKLSLNQNNIVKYIISNSRE